LIDCPSCIEGNNPPSTFAYYFHDIIPIFTNENQLNKEDGQKKIEANVLTKLDKEKFEESIMAKGMVS
jgi:hypothetical protein